MRPIREGQSVALMSPTGTGKTLAYLLPLRERLAQSAGPNPRLLVITPSEDLQRQVGGVLRSLAGGDPEKSVLVLRRNQDGIPELLAEAWAVVATPLLLLEQFELAQLGAAWHDAASGLQALVVDEADCMAPPGGAKNSNLGNVLAFLRRAREEEQGEGDYRPPQVVLASASLDAITLDLLGDAVGVRPSPILAGDELGSMEGPEPEGERPWLWPRGLKHMVMPTERILDRRGSVSRHALESAARAIATLAPQRCLVVLAEKRAASERAGSVGKYLNGMRRQLGLLGYQVATVSAAIEAAGMVGAKRQVLLGRSETIRGLDLEAVDAVILIGELNTSREYMHITGRTARWEAGRGAPEGGTVVSILPSRMANTLKRWGRELGFKLDQLRLGPSPAEWLEQPGEP